MSLLRASTARVCLGILLPLGLASCGNLFSSDCVSIGVAGVTVYVTDASTKGPPAFTPSLRLVDEDYVEEIAAPQQVAGQQVFSAAVERMGEYRLTITALGYQDYVRDNIVVEREAGGCRNLKPVRIDAGLIKTS